MSEDQAIKERKMCEEQATKKGKCMKTKPSRERNVLTPSYQEREICEDQAIKRGKDVKTKLPREGNV